MDLTKRVKYILTHARLGRILLEFSSEVAQKGHFF